MPSSHAVELWTLSNVTRIFCENQASRQSLGTPKGKVALDVCVQGLEGCMLNGFRSSFPFTLSVWEKFF